MGTPQTPVTQISTEIGISSSIEVFSLAYLRKPTTMRGIGRSLLTLDRGATLIAYGSYLARLALDSII